MFFRFESMDDELQCSKISRKILFYLIATLNASFNPDYDFSHCRGDEFSKEPSVKVFTNANGICFVKCIVILAKQFPMYHFGVFSIRNRYVINLIWSSICLHLRQMANVVINGCYVLLIQTDRVVFATRIYHRWCDFFVVTQTHYWCTCYGSVLSLCHLIGLTLGG